MKYEVTASRVTIDFPNRNDGWTLCVVDDHWAQIRDMLDNGYDPLEHESRTRWELKQSMSDDCNNLLAVSLLPYYCQQLSDLRRLVAVDFPREKDIGDLLGDVREHDPYFYRSAFLVDVVDSQATGDKNRPGSEQIVPFLLNRWKVPEYKCALFTTGGGHVPPALQAASLEKLFKAPIYAEQGTPLVNWWDRVHRRICDRFFMFQTSRCGMPHEPSKLTTILLNSASFRDSFVGQQARHDKYGVWEWFRSQLCAELSDVLFAYECAKAFVRSANRVEIPVMALYGLINGLSHQCTETMAVNIGKAAIKAPPEFTDCAELLQSGAEDIPDRICRVTDDINALGTCVTHSARTPATFEYVASSMRDWLEYLHAERRKENAAKLAEVGMVVNGDCARIDMRFSNALNKEMLAGEGGGQVSRAWRDLCSCFEVKPAVAENRRCVRFTLLSVP